LEFFSKVDETFEIAGRGCVVVPTVPRASLEFRLRAKDSIQLRTPDGRVLDTYIAGIEMICGSHVKEHMAFLLPQNITKQEIPKDTEIWLIRA
jgi:hypothetical protein